MSALRRPVHEMSASDLIAEAQRREANRRLGRPLDAMPDDVRTPAEREADDARDEKRVVAAADKQLRALGFVVVEFNQPRRATYLSPGIPDREYFHPGRGVFVKWEAKTARGVQSPAQAQYQEWCRACGVPYVLGTDDALYGWLVAQGIAARTVGELLVPLPYDSSPRSA